MANQSVEELLEDLQREVVKTLLQAIRDGETPNAAMLNVARQLLKDNNISADPADANSSERALAEAMLRINQPLPQ